MKKTVIILLLTALLLTMFACGEKESPAAYLPSIRYDNVPLNSYSVLIWRGNGPADGGGPGAEHTPEELISIYYSNIPETHIFNGAVTLKNGSDKNATFTISFVGVYTKDGEKTEYGEADLSALPDGLYIICVKTTKSWSGGADESNYLFAKVLKDNDGLEETCIPA
ncbi:MAG: hypothetical protein J5585_10775 [Clostridia bacterium]|nr:hypothetical protein [Clostridia bacterium]